MPPENGRMLGAPGRLGATNRQLRLKLLPFQKWALSYQALAVFLRELVAMVAKVPPAKCIDTDGIGYLLLPISVPRDSFAWVSCLIGFQLRASR